MGRRLLIPPQGDSDKSPAERFEAFLAGLLAVPRRTVEDAEKKRADGKVEPQRVIIRAFGGVALVRWLIGGGQRVAYITTDDGLSAVREGRPAPIVGFPKADVFWFIPSVRDGDKPDWRELVQVWLI